MDDETSLAEVKEMVKNFCEEREWDQYHDAKELTTAMILEVSELLEFFRYKNREEVNKIVSHSEKIVDIRDEIADVLFLLSRLAQMYNIDLSEALKSKIEKTALKYPVDKAKGSNKKYNEF